MKVYAAQYSDCIYESDFGTLSLHLTPEGANAAIKTDQATRFYMSDEEKQELLRYGANIETFGQQKYQQYRVEEFEVLP